MLQCLQLVTPVRCARRSACVRTRFQVAVPVREVAIKHVPFNPPLLRLCCCCCGRLVLGGLVVGLFSRGPKVSHEDKVRGKAERAGVSTVGAVVVAHAFTDKQDTFLLVFPDRVDVVRNRKLGTLLGGGDSGVESYPISSITSASVRKSGVWAYLKFTSSNVEVEFKGDVISVPAAREAIMAAKAGA